MNSQISEQLQSAFQLAEQGKVQAAIHKTTRAVFEFEELARKRIADAESECVRLAHTVEELRRRLNDQTRSRRDFFAAAALSGLLANSNAEHMNADCEARGGSLAAAAFGWADLACQFNPVKPQKGAKP